MGEARSRPAHNGYLKHNRGLSSTRSSTSDSDATALLGCEHIGMIDIAIAPHINVL